MNKGRDTVLLEDVEEVRKKAMASGVVAAAVVDAPVEETEAEAEEKKRYGGLTARQIEKIVENTKVGVLSNSRFYEVKVCGGAFGCPRTLFDVRDLSDKMIEIIESCGVPEAVQARAKGPVLRHHKLCVSISGCPNSCSQPQIADFGVQGRARVAVGAGECDGCGECVRVCKEDAVVIPNNQPAFDYDKCINCGDCAAVCPTEAIVREQYGYSALVGGKLGRHPHLAYTLFDFADEKMLLESLRVVCEIFVNEVEESERLTKAVTRIGMETIEGRVRRRV